MLSILLSSYFERNLRKLIKEINLFNQEKDLWIVHNSSKISCGNLVLHIIDAVHHFISVTDVNDGYNYERAQYVVGTVVERKVLVSQLETLIRVINEKINALPPEQMNADFPHMFDKTQRATGDVLMQMLFHLNYHLGQINYLRRYVNKPGVNVPLKGTLLLEKLYQN